MNKFEFIATGKITPILVFGFVDFHKKEEKYIEISRTGINGGDSSVGCSGISGAYERFQNSTRRQFQKHKLKF